ncbi:MAG: penicillin-binding protein activator LpoB [Proteobacteria bacterium]|nr:MAG: penicillin-binding protein activator LpoB [Pseudomonadota bacterium]PIE67162.1 MAG: penicillin-binding protein activator LpoB [Deltaproteobacteria bacterium]
MVSSIRMLIIAVSLLSITACSYEQQYLRKADIRSRARYAAVLPMGNLSSHPHAGRIVGDLLTTELYALSDFQMMESTAVLEWLQADGRDLDEALEQMVAIKAGKQLGVDTIIYGSVSEYRYKRGLDEDPVVGVNVRMLDVPTGKILWAGSKSRTGGCFWFCEDSLNRLAQQVCNDLVTEMVANGKE